MRIHRYLELIWYKGYADLLADSSRAYVGLLWWVLEPVLYMGAFYVAFDLIGLRAGGASPMLFLLCGLVPWKWFASSVQHGSSAIESNSGLLQQVYLPKQVLPCIVLFTNTIKFSVVLSLLLVLTILLGMGPTLHWLALPLVVLLELLIILAVTSLFASLVPFLPELQLVIDNGLMVLMFLSGIFTEIDKLPRKIALILHANPMVPIIEAYRSVLLNDSWPDWKALSWVFGLGILIYALAFWILRRNDRAYLKLMVG